MQVLVIGQVQDLVLKLLDKLQGTLELIIIQTMTLNHLKNNK